MVFSETTGQRRRKDVRSSGKMVLAFTLGMFIACMFDLPNHMYPRSLPAMCGPQIIRDNSNKQVSSSMSNYTYRNGNKIYAITNPKGADKLPPAIVVSESDLFPRRLQGDPSQDLSFKEKYLLALSVGYKQKKNIDATIKKFSKNFAIMLFHYDGRVNDWDEFEWSKRAIHVSVEKQTKWWYAKRYLHPDIVAPYEYIFIWDEDLGVQHFDAEKYIQIVKKHGLEISQPALDPKSKSRLWYITRKVEGVEVHKEKKNTKECKSAEQPYCSSFVEIMAPVFSRDAWRCVWYMIQNDLVHGWGLDVEFKRCVSAPAKAKMGIVDSQWIVHNAVPSLTDQGHMGRLSPRERVRRRSKKEWEIFRTRMVNAEQKYYDQTRII